MLLEAKKIVALVSALALSHAIFAASAPDAFASGLVHQRWTGKRGLFSNDTFANAFES